MTIPNDLLSPQTSNTQTFSSLPADTFVSHFTAKTGASAEKLNCPPPPPPVTIKAMAALLSQAIPWLKAPHLSTSCN